jgi:hypothetical protein
MQIKSIFTTVFVLMQICVFGQKKCLIDMNCVQGKHIKSFFQKDSLVDGNCFLALQSSCYSIGDRKYSEHTKSYVIDQTIDKVWNAYTTGNIKDIWAGKVLEFGGAYSEVQDSFVYNDHLASYGIEEGQIIITKLRYLKGFLKIVVAHKVTQVDEENKQIQFCYMKGGKTEGSQLLSFKEMADGSTLIEHETFYKSHSMFRDKRLYPKLHTKAIDELHANVVSILAQEVSPVSIY